MKLNKHQYQANHNIDGMCGYSSFHFWILILIGGLRTFSIKLRRFLDHDLPGLVVLSLKDLCISNDYWLLLLSITRKNVYFMNRKNVAVMRYALCIMISTIDRKNVCSCVSESNEVSKYCTIPGNKPIQVFWNMIWNRNRIK